MPWEAIKYVSSGVTLLAFIAAIILEIYRRNLLSRERLIELAPGDQRAKLVRATLQEFFDVVTSCRTVNERGPCLPPCARADSAQRNAAT